MLAEELQQYLHEHIPLSAAMAVTVESVEDEAVVLGAFTARASLEDADHWTRFTGMLSRKGRARIAVSVVLGCEGDVVGRFSGEFVALEHGNEGRSLG